MDMKMKLAFAAILMVALVAFVECKRDSERYLHIPAGQELEQPRLKELFNILIEGSTQAGEPHMLVSQLKAALPQASGLKKEVYTHLVGLADDSNHDCPADMLKTCLDIAGLFYNSIGDDEIYPKIQPYVMLIKRLGVTKFNSCLEHLDSNFDETLGRYGKGNDEGFDKLFAAAFDASSSDDATLYQTAKLFSLAYDDFQAKRMIEGAQVNSPSQLLAQLEEKCGKLQSALGGLFDLFNLSCTLEKPGAQPIDRSATPVKFLKLNEYNRICLEMQKDRAEVESNIAKQLS